MTSLLLPCGKNAIAVMAQLQFSDVYFKLEPKNKARYHEKIALIRCEDPYALKKSDFCRDASRLPQLRSVHELSHLDSLILPRRSTYMCI